MNNFTYRIISGERIDSSHKRCFVKMHDGKLLDGFIQVKVEGKSVTVSTHFRDLKRAGNDVAWLIEQNERAEYEKLRYRL